MEQKIQDWQGKIIGWVEHKPNGDKVIKDFYHRILGSYDARQNVTKDFYGRIIAKGDCTGMLLNM